MTRFKNEVRSYSQSRTQLKVGALFQKHGKLGKLKRVLLKKFNWYDLPNVEPCEKACPQLSEYA